MPPVLKDQGVSGPVTALSFYESDETTLILAGTGPSIQIYAYPSSQLLLQTRVFASHAVHGLAVTKPAYLHSHHGTIIVWGGSRISVYTFQVTTCHNKILKVNLEVCIPEIRAPDWILDCSWTPITADGAPSTKEPQQAFLITAHNALLRLGLDNTVTEDSGSGYSLTELSSSSRSVLYSAHLYILSQTRILVAAGTVFGEILLWSCHLKHLGSPDLSQASTSQLHHVFTGHEGSIYGVQLSHQVTLPYSSRGQFFLASCSDDRTIRVWNITDCIAMDGTLLPRSHNDVVPHSTGFRTDCILGFNSSTTPDCCVAVIWAHASRIWGIRFLQHQHKKAGGSTDLALISWGEDATCQQWAIRLTDNEGNALCTTQYNHKATARLHSGKNIWSLGLSPGVCQYPLAATGGADGRISVFNPIAYHKTAFTAFLRNEWRIGEILALCINGSNGPSKSLNTDAIITTSDDSLVHQDSDKLCNPSESLEPSKLVFAADGKANLGSIKGYAFLDERHFILSTSLGALILGALPSLPSASPAPVENCNGGSAHDTGEITWQVIDILDALKHYSLVVSVPQMGIALVAGANRIIYSYKYGSGKVNHLTSVDKKISGLFAQYLIADRFILLVTCVSCPVARLSRIHCENTRAQVENEYKLRLLSDFVPTSMLCLQSRGLLVLGARSGAMAVYDLSESQPGHNEAKVAVACFRRAHGEDAITIITNLFQPLTDTPSLGQYLLTAARDGRYSIYLLTAIRSPAGVMENVCLKTVHASSPPFGPHIEGAYIDFDSHELVLYGFRGKDFVVWNESNYSEILTVECGGKHRSWAYSPRNGGCGGGGSLVWTKASSLNIFSAPRASHMVVRHGGHGREIKALAIHQRDGRRLSEKTQLLATGAEDTSIRVFELRDDKFKCIGLFKKHTTGVQQLQWSECGNFLFSCGGSEEFYVWRVHDVPVLKIGVIQEAVCPPQSQLPDVRITNFQVSSIHQLGLNNSNSSHRFLVSMVYSDSTLRVYSYLSSDNSGQFQMLYQGTYASSCLTQVYQTTVRDKLSLFTAGTDGFIAYWGLDEILTSASSSGKESSLTLPSRGRSPSSATWRCRFRVHQSTVKSMTVVTLIDHSLLIVTGGDDNAVSITRVCFVRDEQELVPAHSTIRVSNAHASAVTATAVLRSPSFMMSQYSGRVHLRFATASNDQRVKLWKVSVDMNRSDVGGLEIRREATMRTSVADASSLGLIEESSGLWKLVVCGIGIDVLSMSDK